MPADWLGKGAASAGPSAFKLKDIPAAACQTTGGQVPEALRREAKSSLLDGLACVIAARYRDRRTVPVPVLELCRTRVSIDPTPWFDTDTVSTADSCFVNAYHHSYLDYDAVQYGAGHAPAVLLPALVALFDAGRIPAPAVLDGYVVGVEAMATVGETLARDLRRRGHHPSSTIGTIACAIACSWAMDLGRRYLEDAASLAACEAPGAMVNLATGARPLQLAGASRAGLTAAVTAASVDARLLPGDWWLRRLRGLAGASAAEPPRPWAAPWALFDSHTFVKPYPACGLVHPLVDRITEVLGQLPMHGRAPREVVVRLHPALARVLPVGVPGTVEEARFSVGYAVALAIRFGRPSASHYAQAVLGDPAIHDLVARIRTEVGGDGDGTGPGWENRGRLTVTLADGTVTDHGFEIPSSIPAYDIWAVAVEKLRALADGVVDPGAVDDCVELVGSFEELTITEWRALMRRVGAAACVASPLGPAG